MSSNHERDSGSLFPDRDRINYEIKSQVAEALSTDCKDCPVQCDLASKLGGLLLTKHMMQSTVEDMFLGKAGDEIDAQIDDKLPPEHADEMKKTIRQMAAGDLDEKDGAIKDTKQQMNDSASNCDGVLKMRASKGGTTYTASICTSSEQYPHSHKNHVSTHIKTSDQES